MHGLGDSHRAELYGSLALGGFLIAGYSRMLHSSALVGVLWFALLGCIAVRADGRLPPLAQLLTRDALQLAPRILEGDGE